MKSPIYWHPYLYELSIRALYGRRYRERLERIAAEIPQGADVVEFCAGDCALYRYFLKNKHVNYLACDINETSLQFAYRQGARTQRLDLMTDPLPPGDFVVMMGSLFQFIPNEREILQKLVQAARVRVVFNEPIRNLAQSDNPLIHWLGLRLSRVQTGDVPHRFTLETLQPLLKELGFADFCITGGGRDLNAVYRIPLLNKS